MCQLDCHDLYQRLGALESQQDRLMLLVSTRFSKLSNVRYLLHGTYLCTILSEGSRCARLKSLSKGTCRAGDLWQADHIIPVCDGGGIADLANLRTLCVPCHEQVTEQLVTSGMNSHHGFQHRHSSD
jgi:hypothetical protein